jgi:hypothetical protein
MKILSLNDGLHFYWRIVETRRPANAIVAGIWQSAFKLKRLKVKSDNFVHIGRVPGCYRFPGKRVITGDCQL